MPEDQNIEQTEWTSGTDPGYFPDGALPDPLRLHRYESLERVSCEDTSTENHPLLRIQRGRYAVEEYSARDDPDSPDLSASYRLMPHYVAYRVPYWPAVALTGVLPAASAMTAAVRWRRSRSRTSRGLCPRCSYDLRATPDRCPECGAAVSV